MTIKMKKSSFAHLICISLVTVGKVYDTAILKTVAAQYVVHYNIVAVGVDAHCAGALKGPVEQTAGASFAGHTNCNAVNYMIGFIIEPRTALYYRVCRVGPGNECHSCNNGIIVAHYIAYPGIDVLLYNLLRRVAATPLVHVPACAHNALCTLKDVHKRGYIVVYCFTDVHNIQSVILTYVNQRSTLAGAKVKNLCNNTSRNHLP